MSVTGLIKKQKASFGFYGERRAIHENAFILATTLDELTNITTMTHGTHTFKRADACGSRSITIRR